MGFYLEGLGLPAGLWDAHQGALAVSLAAPSRSPSCFWERHSRPGLKQHRLTGHKRRSKTKCSFQILIIKSPELLYKISGLEILF